jgi:fructose/tagatose bisphosphate aldolase
MSIEKLLGDLIEAINSNTAAIGGAPVATKTPAGKTTATKTPPAKTKAKGPVNSVEETHALVTAFGEAHGVPKAKEVLASLGLKKLAEVTDANSDDVFDAFTAAAAEEDDGGI